MEAAYIQAELKRRGYTQLDVAKKLGVHPTNVSRTIHGNNVSDRIMRAIADLIEMPVQYVFPDYYLAAPKRSNSKAFGPTIPNKLAQSTEAVNG